MTQPRLPKDLKASARQSSRRLISRVLPTLEHRWVSADPLSGDIIVMRGDEQLIARFNLDALRSEMDREHFALFKTVLNELREQAMVARLAVELAKYDIASVSLKAAGGAETAQQRKAEAAVRANLLARTAKTILKNSPSLKVSEVAAILEERGQGGRFAIAKILRAKLKGGMEGQ
jgi:hypothetical protein